MKNLILIASAAVLCGLWYLIDPDGIVPFAVAVAAVILYRIFRRPAVVVVLLLPCASHAQTAYVEASLSVGGGSGLDGSFPSLGGGVSFEDWSVGGLLGRRDLAPREGPEQASDYFYEAKWCPTLGARGKVSFYGLLGVGGYFSTDVLFIEYGAGASLAAGPGGITLQWSNWDSGDYVSVGYQIPIR